MSCVLAIDPGIRGAGAAVFVDGQLNTATSGDGPAECRAMAQAILAWLFSRCGYVVNVLAVEWPCTVGGRAFRGDANDLFALAGVDAALAAMLPLAEVVRYKPRDWKGSIEKPSSVKAPYPIKEWVKSLLSPGELERVEWSGNVRHSFDVADAIGVGMKATGRFSFGTKRTFARE